QNESGSTTTLGYVGGYDQAQDTVYQPITGSVGNSADECAVGSLHLFVPSSTTYVKHFYSTSNCYDPGNYTVNSNVAGYINTTSAIDEISFKMSSGNFDGIIKMYGLL
ncbi:MAG: hypothetical protein QF704_09495, partial [Anaerolineales bacterium]|nr:hypothetical protein [Anaerolineales bacterium]